MCGQTRMLTGNGLGRPGSARLGSARPGPAWLGSALLALARPGSAWLASARRGPARLASARLGSAPLGSAQPGPAFGARACCMVPLRASWCLGPGFWCLPARHQPDTLFVLRRRLFVLYGKNCPAPGGEGTRSRRHPARQWIEPTWLNSARPGSARPGEPGSARLGLARLGSPRLGLTRLGSARPGPARSARLGLARHGTDSFWCPCPVLGALARFLVPWPWVLVPPARHTWVNVPLPYELWAMFQLRAIFQQWVDAPAGAFCFLENTFLYF